MSKISFKSFNPLNPIKQICSPKIQTGCGLSCDTFEKKVIDIGAKCEYPADVLSNFTETNFRFDKVQVNSMEGLLQSFKTPDIKEQERICSLVGKEAKKAGTLLKKSGVFDGKVLYWQGKKIDRDSIAYQKLLKRAFKAKFHADQSFREALAATKGSILSHSIGQDDSNKTILTEEEFIKLLLTLRDKA